MKLFFLTQFFLSCLCFADFSDYLKKDLSPKAPQNSIKNIDFIYLINLDQRPEKLERCLSKLEQYKISPHRFSAVCGWDLSSEVLQKTGVLFAPGMSSDRWIHRVFPEKQGSIEADFLREDLHGKCVYSFSMTPGGIGCYLSHLSVLQDAYDSGYETIWIMEDDIFVKKDPKELAHYIEKLDYSVGKEGWDILYTDMDAADTPLYTEENDFISDLKGNFSCFWRPDMDLSNHLFAKRSIINEDLLKIGSRLRTHSMIVRRSGMKKILDHAKTHHIFLAYDYEVAIPPNMRLFNIRSDIVTFEEAPSDTRSGEMSQKKRWEAYKKKIQEDLSQFNGWKNLTTFDKLLEFLYEKKPETCVEIGAFGGIVSYQIAKTLSFLKKGFLYSIDAWDSEMSIDGLKTENEIQFWKNLNINQIKESCFNLIASHNLNSFCNLIQKKSNQAASLFSEKSIDFLYIDGNTSSKGSLEDVTTYFPKVKVGGYIVLKTYDFIEKNSSIAFLMKHCEWIKESSNDAFFLVFQKKEDKL